MQVFDRRLQSFLVFIPCYNEEKAITKLSEELQNLRGRLAQRHVDLRVVWVNDASTDQTAFEINHVTRIHPWQQSIHHQINGNLVGVLETILSSYTRFIPEDQDFIGLGVLDGDFSHPPAFFYEMIKKLVLGYDVVIASRFQAGSVVRGVPAHRQLFSVVMSWLFRSFGRVPNAKDYSCGYRVYSPWILSQLQQYKFRCRSFACMVELLMAAYERQATVCEVPFILRYDLKESASRMRVVYTIFETMKVLLGNA